MKYLKYFFAINNLIIFFSILLFFLLIIGINIPEYIFIKNDGRPHSLYLFGAAMGGYDFGGYKIIRIAGFADEPGALALIISYLIILNELTYKSKAYRLFYIFSGILTFSVAFIISFVPIAIYWIVTKVITLKGVLSWGIVLFFFTFFLSTITPIRYAFERLTINRFEKNDSGDYKGDNRSSAIPTQLEAFKNNVFLGVEKNDDYIYKYEFGKPTFASYLAQHGLYGLFFFYLPFGYLLLRKFNIQTFLLFSCLLVNYLQRPGIEDMFAMASLSLSFYSGLYIKNKL